MALLEKSTKIPVTSLLNGATTSVTVSRSAGSDQSSNIYIKLKDRRTGKTIHLSVTENVRVSSLLKVFRRKVNPPKDAELHITFKSAKLHDSVTIRDLKSHKQEVLNEPLMVHCRQPNPLYTAALNTSVPVIDTNNSFSQKRPIYRY